MKNNSTKGKNRRILIIDDNPAIHSDFRKILSDANAPAEEAQFDLTEAALFGNPTIFTGQKGFELSSSYQGQEGLAAVQEATAAGRPFAMAFVDVRMPPGWDGIETTSRMWEADPDLQIVICTAYSDYSWGEMATRLKPSDRLVVLKKPFDSIEARQLADALTEKWRLLQQSREQVRDLEDKVQRRTEELRKSEELFRLITENAADLISIVNVQGGIIYSSPSYQKLLGYTLQELEAGGAFSPIDPEDREKVQTAVRQIINTGASQAFEYRVRHKNGSPFTLESHGVPFRDTTGTIQGALAVARDVTERKQGESTRQLLEVQLRHAQKLESIGRLAAGIAHEINTPLQFIGDNTRFIRDAFGDLQRLLGEHTRLLAAAQAEGFSPELVAAVKAAEQAADLKYLTIEIPTAISQSLEGVEQTTKIVRAMKEFSHPGVAHKTTVDLNKAIESTLTVCRHEWKHLAETVLKFDPDLPLVPVLPAEFNQVVLNLIVNAAHAIGDVVGDGSKGKGTITFSTHRDGDWAEVWITDTGTGIPEDIRDKVFDPFFTTKDVGKGTGQGLAIARSVVVDKHGGTLRFETAPGKGTTFIIRLPLFPQPADHHPGKI